MRTSDETSAYILEKPLPVPGKVIFKKRLIPSFEPGIFIDPYGNVRTEVPMHIQTWKDYLVTEEPEDVPPLITIDNLPVCTPSNHSLITGKKKSRKTLFIVWLISEYFRKGGCAEDVLIADTEQGKKHVWKMKEKIRQLTGVSPDVLSLRGLSPQERCSMIAQAVKEKTSLKILVIDGIRDLLSNINDPDQCTQLVTWEESLIVQSKIHIVNVLHLNKTDNNARGHIGSELLNKAEVNIELQIDEATQTTIVKCESSRDKPFDNFAFNHNEEGLPQVLPLPVTGKVMSEFEERKRLTFVFDGRFLKYNELLEGIQQHFEVGISKAGKLKGRFERNGWIIKTGKDKSPGTEYKLMITTLQAEENEGA